MPERLKVKIKEKWYTVEVEDISARPVIAIVDGERVEVDIESLTKPGDIPKGTPFQELESEVDYETVDVRGNRWAKLTDRYGDALFMRAKAKRKVKQRRRRRGDKKRADD